MCIRCIKLVGSALRTLDRYPFQGLAKTFLHLYNSIQATHGAYTQGSRGCCIAEYILVMCAVSKLFFPNIGVEREAKYLNFLLADDKE